MTTRSAMAVSLILALVVGYLVAGHLLYVLPIGLAPSAFAAGEWIQRLANAVSPSLVVTFAGIFWVAVTLLLVGACSFFLVRRAVRAHVAAIDPGRRNFLTGAVAGAGAALGSMLVAVAAAATNGFFGLGRGGRGWRGVSSQISGAPVVKTHPEWLEGWKGSRVQSYRRFGRTEFQVSDIVLGSGKIKGEQGTAIARMAFERGVNYVDTSPDYSASGSEEAIGRAIAGIRDRLFVATKFCTPTGHLPAGTPVARYKQVVEESLRRLGTDYVDLCHIHSVDRIDRLMDENVHTAFDELKQEGKVRFLGFSSHTPNLAEVARTGVESGRFDVTMLAYHHGMWAPLPDIISRAREEQDMGVVAMKTLKGAKHHGLAGFREHADAYSQAALRWVLSNRDVSCAVISFFEPQHVDEYLHASGGPPGARDLAILREYDRQVAGTHCQPHCGACLDACPEGLPIHDVLRHRMYFEDYGWEKEAMRLYGRLAKSAAACADCSAPCLGRCPVGVAIPERMRGAHDLLTLS